MPKGLIAYELLGGLIPALPEMKKAWRDMNAAERRAYRKQQLDFVRKAKPIRRPEGQFALITSLRAGDGVSDALIEWLLRNFRGQCDRLALLGKPRTHDNMLLFKRETINAWGVEEYWEPDPVLVRELARACPHTRIRWAASVKSHAPK